MNDTPDAEFLAAFAEATDQPAAEPIPAEQVTEQPPAIQADPLAAAEDNQQTPAAETPPAGEAGSVTTPDIWSNASPEHKAAYEAAESRARQAEHRLKSQEGREAAYQGHLHELRKKLAKVGGSVAEQEDPLAFMASDDWTKIKADYGDDLKPVFSALETMAELHKAQQGRFGQMDAAQEEALYERNFGLFREGAPDWEELLYHKDFPAWVESQPPHVRQSFERNRDKVTDPVEAVDVMNRFRRDVTISNPAPAEPTKTQLDHKRAAQLDGARAVTSRAPPVGDTDDTFEAHFNTAARERERQMSAR